MITQKVNFYVSLWEGWQDAFEKGSYILLSASTYPQTKSEGSKDKVIKITAELPCFGGSASCDYEVQGVVEEITSEGSE